MALSSAGQGLFRQANSSSPQAVREHNVTVALAGATGVVHLVLEGGATLTGTVDISTLGDPNQAGGYGAVFKLTDTATPAVTWVIDCGNVVAVGQ